MMSGVPLKTCWAFITLWNNKFYYKLHLVGISTEVVMSLYCVLKKGHYVFYAVQSITIVHLLTEMLYYFSAVWNLKPFHSFSLLLSDTVYGLLILHKAYS
jgi:hypothetical protein